MRPGKSRCGRRPAVRRRTSSSGRSLPPRTKTSPRSSTRCSIRRRSRIRPITSPSGRRCIRPIRTWQSPPFPASARTYRRCWRTTSTRSIALQLATRSKTAVRSNQCRISTPVTPGLDPGVHPSQKLFCKEDGLPGHKRVQSFVLLPLMVAPVIAAIMIRWMFNDQFGVVNAVLEGLALAPVSWLTQRWTAFGVILLTDVWLWTPWFALILLAGLQSLSSEPFEAARIDAASAWRTFRYITLPMLRPVMVVCIVIRAIDAFRTFDIVWTISGGGPARATEVFSIYAYVESFQFLNLARGSAAAVIGAIIIVVFALLLYRILNRFVEVSK